MYYEVHGSGEPVVLLHGAFMTITNNWTGWIGELSKTRKVIAVEMQGHGRTADIERDISLQNLADDGPIGGDRSDSFSLCFHMLDNFLSHDDLCPESAVDYLSLKTHPNEEKINNYAKRLERIGN